MSETINIVWEKIFKTIDLYYCFYNKFPSDEWKDDENRKELLQTSKLIEDTFINPHRILKDSIKECNNCIKFYSKNNSEIKIEEKYILFDINLYKEFINLYDNKMTDEGLLDVAQMYFNKLIAFFGKLIIKKQFIHDNNYICFEVFNIKTNKDEIYTINYDKEDKFGYFYKNT